MVEPRRESNPSKCIALIKKLTINGEICSFLHFILDNYREMR